MVILASFQPGLPSDTAFTESPDTGHPDCICSRCGAHIKEHEFPFRCFTTDPITQKVEENCLEYRYCEFCTTGKRYFDCKNDLELGFGKCDNSCHEW